MPISSPPQTYALDPVGTSGVAVGPQVVIVDDSMVTKCGVGVKGNILIRGPPCFGWFFRDFCFLLTLLGNMPSIFTQILNDSCAFIFMISCLLLLVCVVAAAAGGYENNGSANEESFFTVDSLPGWFNTGDVGYLDSHNYLFLTGRSKEIINKGGETISPFEIEEAVLQHPLVKETLAFAAPHREYQETVGCVVVGFEGCPRVDLVSLHKYLEDKLHRSKWPQVSSL